MPGEGELVYVAGHRTTYGAPFSNIDQLEPGDKISVELPYGSVEYRVTSHRIVDDNDVSVLESRGREELVLQACHPRFFASERYLVYAPPGLDAAREARFRAWPSGWESVRLDEIEPIPVVDGTLLWRPVRRTLDIGAFGINAYVAPKAGDDVVEEHTERSLGHEEVYVVLSGRATFTLDGEALDAPGRDARLHPRRGREAARARRGAGDVGARDRRAAWSCIRAVGRGRTTSRQSGIAPPATTTHISASSRPLSSGAPITRGRSTTSRAPRRWPGGTTTRSSIYAEPWS